MPKSADSGLPQPKIALTGSAILLRTVDGVPVGCDAGDLNGDMAISMDEVPHMIDLLTAP